MPRVRKFNPKRVFRGNQHSSSGPTDVSTPVRPRPTTEKSTPKQSSSSKKLNNSKLPNEQDYEDTEVNFIVDLQIISDLIKSFTQCRFCGNNQCVVLNLDSNFQAGLVHRLVMKCLDCDTTLSAMSSKVIHNMYETNLRYTYALRSIGKGMESAKMFSAIMNLAPPNTKFSKYNKKLNRAATEVSEASMRNAAAEAIILNDDDENIAAAFDGTWQKRGYTSLNGVITVTSFDSGKVLDTECLAKFCSGCVNKINIQNPVSMAKHKAVCKANYSGSSGGMEVAGAKALCGRSETKLGLKYKQYLGDGDSKGFAAVMDAKPYGDDYEINKLECVGHVQKRMGGRLRRLKRDHKKKKLSDDKFLGGTGRLTGAEIDQLQTYYGKAIRSNLNSVEDMQNAVWATFYHRKSTDEEPLHDRCPTTENTWCKYNKAQENGDTYTHTKPLPKAVCDVIEPTYKDLTNSDLLTRCLHGRTQNPNESFNATIWQRLPKTVFVGLDTLKLGVSDAVICFNDGSIGKANVLKRLQIRPGKFTVLGLKRIDAERIRKADKEVNEENKKRRVQRRKLKRKQEDLDEESYCPGGF